MDSRIRNSTIHHYPLLAETTVLLDRQNTLWKKKWVLKRHFFSPSYIKDENFHRDRRLWKPPGVKKTPRQDDKVEQEETQEAENMEFQTAEYRVVGPPGCGKTTWLSAQVEEAVGASRQLPGPARACGACRRPGATTRPPRSRSRVQGSARQAQKRRPRCCFMLWSTMIHHREGPLMQQRLSKLEAAQRLGVSPSTLDRMIRRGELEIEREGRGDRAKVWVLAPGLSSDAPGGQPVAAGPSPEAELAAAREQVRALQELADYRGKLLDEAEWRCRELLEGLRRSQAMLEGLTRALPLGGTEESPRGRRWWPFGAG